MCVNNYLHAWPSLKTETSYTYLRRVGVVGGDDDVELNVLGCRVDILGTNCACCTVLLLHYVHRNHKAH